MPNWCYCDMVIYTDDESKKDNIQKVYELLNEQLQRKKKLEEENKNLPEKKRHSLNWDTYEVYKTLKPELKKEDILKDPYEEPYFRRGTIYDICLDKNDNTIHINYDTAWVPMDMGWDYLLSDYGLKEVTRGEEPMCDVYVNTDKTGRFFPHKYEIDMCVNGDYYMQEYSTIEDVIKDMERYFKRKFNSVEEMEDFFDEIADESDDNFIDFNDYDIDDDEY